MYFIHTKVLPGVMTKDLLTFPWQIIYISLVCWYPSLLQKESITEGRAAGGWNEDSNFMTLRQEITQVDDNRQEY